MIERGPRATTRCAEPPHSRDGGDSFDEADIERLHDDYARPEQD